MFIIMKWNKPYSFRRRMCVSSSIRSDESLIFWIASSKPQQFRRPTGRSNSSSQPFTLLSAMKSPSRSSKTMNILMELGWIRNQIAPERKRFKGHQKQSSEKWKLTNLALQESRITFFQRRINKTGLLAHAQLWPAGQHMQPAGS